MFRSLVCIFLQQENFRVIFRFYYSDTELYEISDDEVDCDSFKSFGCIKGFLSKKATFISFSDPKYKTVLCAVIACTGQVGSR